MHTEFPVQRAYVYACEFIRARIQMRNTKTRSFVALPHTNARMYVNVHKYAAFTDTRVPYMYMYRETERQTKGEREGGREGERMRERERHICHTHTFSGTRLLAPRWSRCGLAQRRRRMSALPGSRPCITWCLCVSVPCLCL